MSNVGGCSKARIICKVEGVACGANHTDEKRRMLAVRVREVLVEGVSRYVHSQLGKHTVDVHGGNDFGVKCKFLR